VAGLDMLNATRRPKPTGLTCTDAQKTNSEAHRHAQMVGAESFFDAQMTTGLPRQSAPWTMGPHEEAVMTKHGGLTWRVAVAILLGASVLLSAPALAARDESAAVNPVAGHMDANVTFDINTCDV